MTKYVNDQHRRIDVATAGLDAPVAVVDLVAFDRNVDDVRRRAGGTPVRVASKSVRCRSLIERVLRQPGFRGVLGYSVHEAIWLAGAGIDDVVVAYPSAERAAMRELVRDERACSQVTLMVDSVDQLDLIDAATADLERVGPVRVCLELDASYRPGDRRLHLGPRRSPLRTPEHAAAFARAVLSRPGFSLVGLMAYEGQVAGLVDRPLGKPLQAPVIRALKRRSVRELAERRTAAVAAVRAVADLEFVNGGGTGSIETTVAETGVTEVAAGSGFLAPTLFDRYDAFSPTPAAFFGVDVTRIPGPWYATVTGGGWIASGAAGRDRLPTPTYPAGLTLTAREGAGEVQTPLQGDAAGRLRIGERVWFRHTKAGELCERVDALHLVEGDMVVDVVPTYRGEDRTYF